MELLSRYVPEFDRSARHAIAVRADVQTVLTSIRETNLAQSGVIRALFERLCNAGTLAGREPLWGRGLTLDTLQAFGCVLLRSEDENEIGLGAIVSASAERIVVLRADAATFGSFVAPNSAKAIWHFSAASAGRQCSTLALETRLCGHGGTYGRRLLRRWDAFARLGAEGRRDVITAIKVTAEAGGAARSARYGWD